MNNGADAFLDLQSSECCKIPKTNREFWVRKIMRNRQRDEEVKEKLAKMGWRSITIWECQLSATLRQQTLESLVYTLSRIFLADHRTKQYTMEESESLMVAED